MTKDEILRMAREADEYADKHAPQYVTVLNEWQEIRDARFVALFAAAEREAIAQMVENAPPLAAFANDNGGCVTCGFTPKLSARAIRARGQHD